MRQFSDEMQQDDEGGVVCWKAYSAELFVEEKHLTWTALSYNNNPENTKTLKMKFKNDWYSIKADDFEDHVVLDECLMTIEGSVRISRTTPIRHLPVQVHSYLEYRAQLDGCNINHISVKMSKKEFCSTALPTHIKLVIYPVQTQSVLNLHWTAIPILSLTLSSGSIDMLFSETKVLEKATSSSEDIKQTWMQLLRRILTYLRLEYSVEQLFYSIVGSFSHPVRESAAWPEEMINEATVEDINDL
ncbi:hypothetical protein EON65_00965 [archaeon]|nr:MAG: hypothetical protein EON65_00965 [archaeon]